MLQWVGAVDETRTRDLHLGKVALYQLSYYRMSTVPVDNRPDQVRTKRLELLRLGHQNLNLARLPIPPRPHVNRIGRESDPLEIRTPDTLIKSQVLCQLS